MTAWRRAYVGIATTISECHSIMHKYFCYHFDFNTNVTQSHPLTLQTQSSSINALRYSFYMNTPFVWNSIPYKILSLPSSSLDHGSTPICLPNISFCSKSMFLCCCFLYCVFGDHLVQAVSLLCTLSIFG